MFNLLIKKKKRFYIRTNCFFSFYGNLQLTIKNRYKSTTIKDKNINNSVASIAVTSVSNVKESEFKSTLMATFVFKIRCISRDNNKKVDLKWHYWATVLQIVYLNILFCIVVLYCHRSFLWMYFTHL